MTRVNPSLAATAPVTTSMVAAAADKLEVCRRPLLRKVTDRATGQVTAIPLSCCATRESFCPACADQAKRLRMHQCDEGWHLTDDPLPPEPDLDEPGDFDDAADGEDDDGEDQGAGRRVRSTRRLPGFPDLPKVDAEHTSFGRTFTDPRTGATFRPSMFVTLTLGLLRPDRPRLGGPSGPGPV
jgi:hypothetical protein